MNILYGVQATGNGHINRSREVIKYLRKNHEVEVLFSGREIKKFWGVEDFKPYSVYDGLTFKTKNGSIDYIETIQNLKVNKFFQDIKEYNSSHDLIITDFEPITSRIAKKLKIPSIGLAHQYAFKYDIPGKDVISSTIMKLFAPADIEIGIHWWHFGGDIIPPIIPQINGVKEENKILVYLPWQEIDDNIFKKFDSNFVIYKDIKKEEIVDNVVYKPFSRDGFIYDLKTCNGVIANAGFQLSSEAISLGKKLLVVPLKGQAEQESNAKVLQKLNLGMSIKNLEKSNLLDYWFYKYKSRSTKNKNTAKRFVDWLEVSSDVNDLKEIWNG